ncbi:hypothetical protein LTR70_001503 [Exophiala xenobiotica]|uniref:DUF4419 domain-containing protein n=1 Tax=Lithohypha guttulata TaxID=1690604 RepID=A0ABR0KGZ4_9EURO|nr:hypothetical protein LTR24_002793 [Lithohypha guttulata]KAK5327880.1 hypothetical protein LTR70_001503 [Exophiala xenobiotica]
MVCVVPSAHGASAISHRFVDSALEILPKACKEKPLDEDQELSNEDSNIPVEILQSSFDEDRLSSALIASNNGLVYSIIDAYSQHHHLQLRPEDIWFAILSQISNYINAHAEELRQKFVEHEGQKELKIEYYAADRYSVDFSVFAREMAKLLERNIVDKDFRDWVMPAFSTTTAQDEVIASILMMGSMQKYFTYLCQIVCGIPSVTLMGEKTDYEKILNKLDYLSSLGAEPEQFAALLKPVICRMIRTFDDPTDPAVVNFWQRILDVDAGSGFTTYSGWISAFCFWNEDGKSLYHLPPEGRFEYSEDDGVRYHKLDSEVIPPGWCKVPVTVDDNGKTVQTEMVAGSVGILCSSSGREDASGNISLDTMQPETGWWIFEKKSVSE